jgi:hypothetical protein
MCNVILEVSDEVIFKNQRGHYLGIFYGFLKVIFKPMKFEAVFKTHNKLA